MGLFIPLCLLGSQLSIPALLPIHGLHFPASVFSEWDLAYCSVTYGGNQITQSGQRGGAQQRGRWKHWLWKGHHLSSQRNTGLDAGALFFWVFLVFFLVGVMDKICEEQQNRILWLKCLHFSGPVGRQSPDEPTCNCSLGRGIQSTTACHQRLLLDKVYTGV